MLEGNKLIFKGNGSHSNVSNVMSKRQSSTEKIINRPRSSKGHRIS